MPQKASTVAMQADRYFFIFYGLFSVWTIRSPTTMIASAIAVMAKNAVMPHIIPFIVGSIVMLLIKTKIPVIAA